MGLAGPKERTKISKDPRNTFWSNDTSRFGHKYLANLGWTPGQTLGDTSSSYHASGHITDASSNGIKIMLKDDTLGIGAKKGAQHDECTGLLGLQGLLGRLNGDEKQVEMVKKEEDRRKTEWVSSKFGMRFVRGEIWKADDISKLREQMVQDNKTKEVEVMIKKEDESDDEISEEVTEEKDKRKKGKKRKRSSAEDENNKKRKKSKAKAKAKRGRWEESEDEKKTRPKGKKSKRSKSTTSTTASVGETESESKRPKKEKEGRRLKEKRSRKDTKSKEKARKVTSLDLENSSGSEEVSRSTTTDASTVVSVTTGRNAVRARFIAAKRSAMMDAKSLNEILMIKA